MVILMERESSYIPELGEFVIAHQSDIPPGSVNEINKILTTIKLASKVVSLEISRYASFSISEIEAMTDLEQLAQNKFIEGFRNRETVAGVATAGMDGFLDFGGEARNRQFVVNIHPLDGSSGSEFNNVETNVSVGTVFAIYRRVSPIGGPVELRDFLQPGKNIIAAGYVLFGSSVLLMYSSGSGLHGFTLDTSLGSFLLSHPDQKMPTDGKIYSIDGGRRAKFPQGIKDYITYCQDNIFSLRYIGSLIADIHRNLLKGGIFLYPPTFKDPKPSVSMVFQCAAIAYITEQAGGKASDGHTRLLDLQPKTLHDRVVFICGSKCLCVLLCVLT